jgi:hypothetical protein
MTREQMIDEAVRRVRACNGLMYVGNQLSEHTYWQIRAKFNRIAQETE